MSRARSAACGDRVLPLARVATSSLRACVALLTLGAACGGAQVPERGPEPAAMPTVAAIRAAAIPITGAPTDYDALMRIVGDARVVLLGESTHGTHEFYRERARITQRLIAAKRFSAVAVEGDWPDAYRVNRWIRGLGDDRSAEEALSSFTQFPRWMWRNEDVRDLVRSLRTINDARPPADRVGFYGLDVYSLYESIGEVERHLGSVDTAAARRVRTAYRCFRRWAPDAQTYGSATQGGTSRETQAAAALAELTRRGSVRPADAVLAEAEFSALRNAHTVANAERYFRTMYTGGISTSNIRDQEMADALGALEDHLRASTGREPKLVVWAHNTHTGDARVTDAGEQGEHNIGQLMRQRHGERSILVGAHTYTGTVMAAREWGETGRVQDVRPGLPDSYSGLFHATGLASFLLPLRGGSAATAALSEPRLQRAIGVIYLPNTERQSHYFMARLGAQFDAVIFFDTTRAVVPLR